MAVESIWIAVTAVLEMDPIMLTNQGCGGNIPPAFSESTRDLYLPMSNSFTHAKFLPSGPPCIISPYSKILLLSFFKL